MNQKKHGSMDGKGYYIALILCAAAIGIFGYVYQRNHNQAEKVMNKPVVVVDPTEGPEPAVDPEPSGTTEPAKKFLKTGTPVSGETVAEYAMDCLSYNETTRDWRVHNGVDIAAEPGTKVRAAADGVVYTVYEDDAMGMTVVIRHDLGYTTKYASLAPEISVSAGDTVQLGQAIGCVGRTALRESALEDHVHFSVTRNDRIVDPEEFLNLS